MGTELQFCKMKSSGDGWWGRLHNNVNIFIITELYTKKCLTINFMLCACYHNFFFKIKRNQSINPPTNHCRAVSKLAHLQTMQCSANQAHPTWEPPPLQKVKETFHYCSKIPLIPSPAPPGADSAPFSVWQGGARLRGSAARHPVSWDTWSSQRQTLTPSLSLQDPSPFQPQEPWPPSGGWHLLWDWQFQKKVYGKKRRSPR